MTEYVDGQQEVTLEPFTGTPATLVEEKISFRDMIINQWNDYTKPDITVIIGSNEPQEQLVEKVTHSILPKNANDLYCNDLCQSGAELPKAFTVCNSVKTADILQQDTLTLEIYHASDSNKRLSIIIPESFQLTSDKFAFTNLSHLSSEDQSCKYLRSTNE